MPALVTSGICKNFGRRVVLQDVAITVPERGFLCLLGESGAGKSTLLRIIAGLEQPTRGTVTIGTRDVTRDQTNQRNIAYVFQDADALFPNLSVRENIEFPLRIGGRQPRGGTTSNALDDVMSTLRLNALTRRTVHNLSGGEKQRVALARSLVYESSLLLLDEPVSSLDNMTKVEFRNLLRRIHSQYQCSTLLVTHDEREAQAIGTHVAILDRSVIVQSGPTGDVVDNPATPRSALLLGGWSLVQDESGKLASAFSGLDRKLAAFRQTQSSRSQQSMARLTVGFREDRLKLVSPPVTDTDVVSVHATVRTIHPWYGRKRMIAEIPDSVAEISAILDGSNGYPEVGKSVTLVSKETDVRIWEGTQDDT